MHEDHIEGVQFITGVTLEKFTVRLYEGEEMQSDISSYFLSVSILCLHTQAQSKPSPASTGNDCLLLFYLKKSKQLTVPQNSEVSCHLCVALYDTLKLKSSALVTLDFTSVTGGSLCTLCISHVRLRKPP